MQCSMFVPASNLGTTLDESVTTVDVYSYQRGFYNCLQLQAYIYKANNSRTPGAFERCLNTADPGIVFCL